MRDRNIFKEILADVTYTNENYIQFWPRKQNFEIWLKAQPETLIIYLVQVSLYLINSSFLFCTECAKKIFIHFTG